MSILVEPNGFVAILLGAPYCLWYVDNSKIARFGNKNDYCREDVNLPFEITLDI